MDQLIGGATLLALVFLLFQVVQGKRATRRKQQGEESRRQQSSDKAHQSEVIPQDVIAKLREQAPAPAPQPAPRKRKKR